MEDLKKWQLELLYDKEDSKDLNDAIDINKKLKLVEEALLEYKQSCDEKKSINKKSELLPPTCFNTLTIIDDKKMKYDFSSVKLPHELGNFIQLQVNLKEKRTKCNCELNHYLGDCIHYMIIEMIEFGRLSNSFMMDANGTNWKYIREQWKYRFMSSLYATKKGEDTTKHDNFHKLFGTINPNIL